LVVILDAASLEEAFGERIPPSTDFCCDGGKAITAFAKRAKLEIHVLPAPGKPKPEEPQFHINNVNAYHGRLKGVDATPELATNPRGHARRRGPGALDRRRRRTWTPVNTNCNKSEYFPSQALEFHAPTVFSADQFQYLLQEAVLSALGGHGVGIF